jgi:DNA invertase Pin-like site-specific DNA recombinase
MEEDSLWSRSLFVVSSPSQSIVVCTEEKMKQDARTPAATYLRMSTERQQYSLANQSEVINQYADAHGFSIVKTYSDPARTGVVFRRRKGLQSLIQDVVQDIAPYKAILVYDVSRWGRFQDIDESAHYEFLCKSAGRPVHYCAEPFANDTGLSSLIMKSLKRVMAGEYSRELGVKIFNAQRKLACLGFRQGGQPGFGLRRLLVSANGEPRQVLRHGERKSLASDRVIQIPGPRAEVRCIRQIFRLFIQKKMNFLEIAMELKRQKTKYLRGSEWDHKAVRAVLTHPKYAGINVYGRSSSRLYTPRLEVPRSEWAVRLGAFEAVVEPETFHEAQRILATFTRNKSDASLLEVLKAILEKEGKLSMDIIESTPGVASPSTFRTRFGSISRAYELTGYVAPNGFARQGRLEELRNIRRMRTELMNEIVSLSKGRVTIEDRGKRFRTRLKVRNRLVAVVVCRCFLSYKDANRWLMKCVPGEDRLVTVLARLNPTNDSFTDYFVVPPIGTSKSVRLLKDDPRLNRTVRLDDRGDFMAAVATASTRKQPSIIWEINEKSVAIATNDQLRRLAAFSQKEFMRRGMNQRTMEKIRAVKPVRPSILEKCLELLRQCEAEGNSR